MSLPKINPVKTNAWKKLIAQKDIINKKSLKELFNEDKKVFALLARDSGERSPTALGL